MDFVEIFNVLLDLTAPVFVLLPFLMGVIIFICNYCSVVCWFRRQATISALTVMQLWIGYFDILEHV